MSRKGHKDGGKYGGSHTTVTSLAEVACDLIYPIPEIYKIVPSFIKSGLRSANGKRRIAITGFKGGILLSVRDNVACQKIWVYTSNLQDTKLQIARKLRDKKIDICFKGKN